MYPCIQHLKMNLYLPLHRQSHSYACEFLLFGHPVVSQLCKIRNIQGNNGLTTMAACVTVAESALSKQDMVIG